MVLTNGSTGNKNMEIGKKHAGKMFVDICGHPEKVLINEDGWGDFFVADKSVSVWIAEDCPYWIEYGSKMSQPF